MRIKVTISLAFLLISHIVFSQNVKVLPDDPRIQKGSIANGFTYYLIDNDVRPGYADFYLIRKVGSLHEGEGEFGFNTLIANMGVEGTRNFPNNTIISFFDEMGLDHHSDFETINGIENSLYKVTNIPVGKGEATVDSTLLILYNWAVNINLDEEDVEKGKRLYVNQIMHRLTTEKVGTLRHLSEILGDDYYDNEANIDSILTDIEGYKAKDIRSFYYKWFSPDRMSLVVVGDIDSKVYDTKIKSLFQALPLFLEEVEERHVDMGGQSEPIISIVPNEEGTQSKLRLYFTTPSLPMNLRGTAVPYVEDYMSAMMEILLTEKLVQASGLSDLTFTLEDVSYDRFLGGAKVDALKIDITTLTDDVKGVLGRVLGILYGLKRDGFTGEQFERAQKLYFRDLNYFYDWRILTPNSVYAERAIDNYIYGTSLASVEMKKEYMDLVRYQVGPDQFNMFVSSFLRNGDNCIITYNYPSNGTVKGVSKGELRSVVDSVLSNGQVKDVTRDIHYKPFKYSSDAQGSILSEYPEMITGSKVWNLSNGATVVYKRTQTEPNKFTFEAISKGGLSLMPSDDYSREYINEIASIAPVGNISSADISLYKRYERATLDRCFGMNTTSLRGGGYSQRVEDFMKMVALYFSPIEGGNRDFQSYKKIKSAELASRASSPRLCFDDTLSKMLYNESRYVSIPDSKEFGMVDYDSAVSFINKRFSNAANFHFIIVGDLDETLLKSLVNKYIASLPGKATARESWVNVPLYLRKYDQRREFSVPMSIPKTIYNYTLNSSAPYNLKGVVDMTISSEVIKKRVCREMEERGFPLEIETEWIRHPEEFLSHSFTSVTKDYSEEFVSGLTDILLSLEEEGATSMEIKNAKMVILEGYNRGEKESTAFWRDLLVNRFIYGKDFYSRYSEFVEGASDEEVNQAIKGYLQNAINTILIFKGIEK